MALTVCVLILRGVCIFLYFCMISFQCTCVLLFYSSVYEWRSVSLRPHACVFSEVLVLVYVSTDHTGVNYYDQIPSYRGLFLKYEAVCKTLPLNYADFISSSASAFLCLACKLSQLYSHPGQCLCRISSDRRPGSEIESV